MSQITFTSCRVGGDRHRDTGTSQKR